jgi:hypothetical protein
MALYSGKAHWLYQQLKRKYVDIHKTERGLMPFTDFKTKIDKGTEFWFAGNCFRNNEKISVSIEDKLNDQFFL